MDRYLSLFKTIDLTASTFSWNKISTYFESPKRNINKYSMMEISILPLIILIVINGVFEPINATSKAIDSLPEDYTYFSFLNAAYKIHTEKLSWSNAKEKCIEEGATLADIDTDPKVQVIASLKKSKIHLWTGISRESKAMPWLAIDQETVVSYLPWAPSEPTCIQNCIAIDARDRGVGNKNCRLRKGFVCEIKE